jgi:hypothetical protein
LAYKLVLAAIAEQPTLCQQYSFPESSQGPSWRTLPSHILAADFDQGLQDVTDIKTKALNFKISTYNVQTAITNTSKLLVVKQFEKHKMLMMGVQEARHKFDAFLEFPRTYFITTAADKGSYGCALLINKKVPYGTNDSGELFISRDHITVSLAEPHKLVVHIDAPYFSCVVFVFSCAL